jgi:thiol-disulfide isomerase/thioredoxin
MMMKMKRRWGIYKTNALLAAAAFTMVLAWSAADAWHYTAKDQQEMTEAKELQCFKNFSAETLDGDKLTQDDFKDNRLTLVNAWATTCPSCIAEFPDLDELNQEYGEQGVRIVGVCTDLVDAQGNIDAAAYQEAAGIVAETGARFKNMIPSEEIQEVFIQSVVNATPTTLFLDGDGNVIDMVVGARTREAWRDLIDDHLKTL